MKLLQLISLTFLLTACTPENAAVETPDFFDLKGYIASEVERLSGQPLRVTKTITLNGETETQELDKLNFENDLKLFAGADINKNSWLDKYETETEQLSGQHQFTRYVALDSSLTTQFLEIEEDRGQPIKIKIVRKTGTVLSAGKSEMVYQPSRGYSVITQQDNRFGDDVDALVKVEW